MIWRWRDGSKISLVLIMGVLVFSLILSVALERQQTPKIINLVFDDSGSTVADGVDTWAQQRYAMQLFAAMLGEKDTLNIYLMSQSLVSDSPTPDFVVNGSLSISERVRLVYDMPATETLQTPLSSVERAFQHLSTQADSTAEKWLIVMTDGAFNDYPDVTAIYKGYTQQQPSLKIVTLAIGENIGSSIPTPSQNIELYRAKTGKDIIKQLAIISNRMFDRHVIATKSRFQLDVPVEEIFVLAQGDDVTIKGLDDASMSMSDIQILHSDKTKATLSAEYIDDIKTIELKGKVAAIKPSGSEYFDVGDYDLGISGALDINVYYKPYVALALSVFDSNGDKVTTSEVVEGDYKIKIEVVHPKTGIPIKSDNLGEINYHLTVNGDEINNDGMVSLNEGDYIISGSAQFLDYNEIIAESKLTATRQIPPLEIKDIFSKPYTIEELPQQTSQTGFTLYREGERLSEDLWQAMAMPTLSWDKDVAVKITKGSTPGDFIIDLDYVGEGKFDTYKGKFPVAIQAVVTDQLGDTLTAEGEIIVDINNNIPCLERLIHWITHHIVLSIFLLLILLWLMGYLPLFKNYLPKSLKRRPLIETKALKSEGAYYTSNGKCKKHLLTTILPYKSEECTVKYTPYGYEGVAPQLHLKATRGKQMKIVNYKKFAGKSDITFGDRTIEEMGKKPYMISVNFECVCQDAKEKNICHLNRSK